MKSISKKETTDKEYFYLISFCWENNSSFGLGSSVYKLQSKIDSLKQFDNILQEIKRTTIKENIGIISYQLIEEKETQD